ncbi:hypothetical protein AB0I49_15430 [Streptomyces sp. NPDC050617]|uniref:hypothetical protein n=1 Tax=Streptomyces sp. NPDC050617 TaxID=3154628 RepID=UPI0034359EED
MNEADEERELRRLLEHAVPRLSAPEQRMRQVRRRVTHRRRRRTAGLAAGVAAVALAAVLSWPSAVPAPTEEPIPVASGSTGRPVRYSELLGLGYRLPPGWHAQAPTVPPDNASPTAFAATQPLSGRPACAEKTATGSPCGPLDALDSGGALVAFRRTPVEKAATDASFRLTTEKSPTPECRKIGGTRELTASRTVLRDASPDLGTGEDEAIAVSVCLREPAGASLAQARDLLASVAFGGPEPTATRGSGR